MSRLLLAAAAVLLVAAPPSHADRVAVKLKPGGKLQLDYGRPQWHDDLEAAFASDFTWRFGANSATVLETEAGLVFDDLVVFPDSYGLNALFYADHPGRWHMVFHGDGHWYQRGVNHGEFWADELRVDGDDASRRFTVAFPRNEDGYVLQATYGPRRIELPFRAFRAKNAKGKAGRVAFEAQYLLRTDLEGLEESLAKEAVGVARLRGKKVEKPLRLLLRAGAGGDAPKLAVVDTSPGHSTEPVAVLDGQTGIVAKPSATFGMTVKSGKEAAALSFAVGSTSYHFDLPASVFDE